MESRQVSGEAIGLPVGKLRAKQIREAPDYPTQNLYPCHQGPERHVFWLLNNLNLTEGIIFNSDGHVSYAPAMVARMRIGSFRVHVHIDGFDEECKYKLRMYYTAKSGEVYEQYSDVLWAKDWDTFVFDIPLAHVNPRGWFTCVLNITLKTPMPLGPERKAAEARGLENPHMPIIVRGAYLEIRG